MDARLAVSLTALALLLPAALAQEVLPGPADARCKVDARDAAPPCGWILPAIDIDVPDKQACGGGRLIYADEPPEDCDPLQADGAQRTYPATFRWYWEMSEDGTYPKEAGQDIEISFSGTATNPSWLKVEVTGEGMQDGKYVIDDAELANPDNLRVEEEGGTLRVWFDYRRDIDITFTRDGGPSDADMRLIDARHGVVVFFLKAKSTDSEPRFKEAFGVEEFRFNACSDAAVAARVDACPGLLQEDGSYLPLEPGENERSPGLQVGIVALLGLAGAARMRSVRRQ